MCVGQRMTTIITYSMHLCTITHICTYFSKPAQMIAEYIIMSSQVCAWRIYVYVYYSIRRRLVAAFVKHFIEFVVFARVFWF